MEVFQDECDLVEQLAGPLDINTVDEMRETLLAHLQQNASIAIDLSAVVSCDAAGAQLLLALKKSAEAAGKSFAITATSEVLIQDCANLGITIQPSIAASARTDELGSADIKRSGNSTTKKSTKLAGEGTDA